MSPLIGITCSYAPDKIGRPEFPDFAVDYLKSQYSQSVHNAGGIPVILPNLGALVSDETTMQELLSHLDGVLFSGGIDIEPKLFGCTECHPKTQLCPERDCLEVPLLRYVLERTQMPLLFICRGHQLLNAILGGTLYQDISQFWADLRPPALLEHRRIPDKQNIRHSMWHRVIVREGTQLSRILGEKIITVNSSHHQFIREMGKGLVISAVAPDGAIEAMELSGDRFALSVQWHPEAIGDEYSKKLFGAFVAASKDKPTAKL